MNGGLTRRWAILLAVLAATVLGAGMQRAGAKGRPAPTPTTIHLSLSEPEGMTFDSRGHLYVADTGHDRVVELTTAGRLLRSWGTKGKKPGQLDQPGGVAVDAQGDLYIADFNNRRLQKLSPAGKMLARWNNNDPQFGCECHDVTVDARGTVYVADESTIYLYRFSSALKLTAKWDTGSSSLLAVRQDSHGNLWITTAGNQVEEVSPAGKALARWGRQGSKRGQFNEPDALALDGAGNVYVADAANNRVQKLTAKGKPLTVFGASGPDTARANNPEGVAVDARGNVYVADTYNDRIQVFSPSGTLLAIWSST